MKYIIALKTQPPRMLRRCRSKQHLKRRPGSREPALAQFICRSFCSHRQFRGTPCASGATRTRGSSLHLPERGQGGADAQEGVALAARSRREVNTHQVAFPRVFLAAGHRRARVVQNVLHSWCLRGRHGGSDGRRPEQSGSKRVLHSHIERTLPQAVPALAAPGSGLGDESGRLVVPTPPGLARRHAQPLRSSPEQFVASRALAAFCKGRGSTVPGRRGRLCRTQSRVTAQRLAAP